MKRVLRVLVLLGLLLLSASCYEARQSEHETVYAASSSLYWVVGAGAVVAAVLGTLYVRESPDEPEAYLLLFLPLVAIGVMWVASTTSWVLTVEGFRPPSRMTSTDSMILYADISQLDLVTQSAIKGDLRFWCIHRKGLPVERIHQPDQPIRDQILQEIRARKIPIRDVREPFGVSSLKFILLIVVACGCYFGLAIALAAWARRRLGIESRFSEMELTKDSPDQS